MNKLTANYKIEINAHDHEFTTIKIAMNKITKFIKQQLISNNYKLDYIYIVTLDKNDEQKQHTFDVETIDELLNADDHDFVSLFAKPKNHKINYENDCLEIMIEKIL